jgi:AraC-like DNA-binding protein
MNDLTPQPARPGPDALPLRVDSLFYREADRAYLVAPHVHRVHQWYVLLHGGVDMVIGERTIALHPEQSVVVPPGAVRSPRCRAKAPGYLVAIVECVGLDLAPISGRALDTPLELREDLLALVDELRLPKGPDSGHLARALVARLLIGLKRAASTGQRALSPTHAAQHHEVVERAQAFMERNFYRTLTRAEIARAVHLSEPQLGRVFKAATGETVLDQLTGIRIRQAKALLLGSDLPVTQIALDVGITSFSHFANIFKQATGLTPSDYRRLGGRAYT